MIQVQFPGEHLIELAQDSNYIHSQQHAVFAESTKSYPIISYTLNPIVGNACLRVCNAELYQTLF